MILLQTPAPLIFWANFNPCHAIRYSQSGLGIISCCSECSVIGSACADGAGNMRPLIIVAVSSLKEYGTCVLLDFSVSDIISSTVHMLTSNTDVESCMHL